MPLKPGIKADERDPKNETGKIKKIQTLPAVCLGTLSRIVFQLVGLLIQWRATPMGTGVKERLRLERKPDEPKTSAGGFSWHGPLSAFLQRLNPPVEKHSGTPFVNLTVSESRLGILGCVLGWQCGQTSNRTEPSTAKKKSSPQQGHRATR